MYTKQQIEKGLELLVEKWMFKDINASIEGKANYMAALTLSIYTAFLGGLLTGKLSNNNNKNNYITFLMCMGYSKEEAEKCYRYVYRGFIDQYFIKEESTVHMKGDGYRGKGILIKNNRIDFYVTSYFAEFQKAYYKYKPRLIKGLSEIIARGTKPFSGLI